MERTFRIAAAALSLLLLTSCTMVYRVSAVFVDGRLTFVSEDDEVKSSPWCWNNFSLINDEGEPVWEFDAYDAYRRAERCGPNFPLTYGTAPIGAEVHVGPHRLQPGRLYVISGSAAGILEGAFVLHRGDGLLSIENIDPRSPEVELATARHGEWRTRHEPPNPAILETGSREYLKGEQQALMVPQVPAAGAAGTDGRTWLLNTSEPAHFPSLSYASLDGRDIRLNLWCRWRGAVNVDRVAAPHGNAETLELSSGSHRLSTRLDMSRHRSEPVRSVGAVAETDPVLRNFGTTGRLTMQVGGQETALDAVNDHERRRVRRFLEFCSYPNGD